WRQLAPPTASLIGDGQLSLSPALASLSRPRLLGRPRARTVCRARERPRTPARGRRHRRPMIPSATEAAPVPATARDSRLSLVILAIGLVSASLYAAAFTFTWPLWRLFTQPQADYAWFGRYTQSSQAQY